jgi:hypothetical protein
MCWTTASSFEAVDKVKDGRSEEERSAGPQQDQHAGGHEVRYWTQELGVTKEQLQKLVDKVGSSAAAVRKELAA